jgi:hypothetical protein
MSATKGAVVQLQRKGFYIIDEVKVRRCDTAAAGSAAAAAAAACQAGNDGSTTSATSAMLPAGSEPPPATMAAAAAITQTAAAITQTAAVNDAAGNGTADRGSSSSSNHGWFMFERGLQPSDVEEVVLFAIPDGHLQHEVPRS